MQGLKTYLKGFYHAHNIPIFHMDQNSHFKPLFFWLSFPSLTDVVLIACSFMSFITWGNNLSVLGWVLHLLNMPGLELAWVHSTAGSRRRLTHWNFRNLLENLLLCSLQTWCESQWCDWFCGQDACGSDSAALGDGPFGPVQAFESFSWSCACWRMVPEVTPTPSPTSWASTKYLVALCSWRQTQYGMHLKFILTGLRKQGDQKERKWWGAAIISVI